MTEPRLRYFCFRHIETLKTLNIKDLYLTKGSRKTLLEFIGGEMRLTFTLFDGFRHQGCDYPEFCSHHSAQRDPKTLQYPYERI